MRNILRTACLATICAVLPVLSSAPATALPSGPLQAHASEVNAASQNIDTVQYRNRGGRNFGNRGGRRYGNYRGYRGRNNFGRNAGIGIGAAIIGGVILSEAARAAHRNDNSGDWELCADTYRSFEPSTGMYTGYDGVRRTCPYLH